MDPPSAVALASEPTLMLLRESVTERAHAQRFSRCEYPDERLKLLFVCAHPAIDPPCTRRLCADVWGWMRAHRACLFCSHLPRWGSAGAARRNRDAGIQFEFPQEREWRSGWTRCWKRFYAAFGIGWDDMAGVTARAGYGRGGDLLARVLLQLMPEEAEVRGLLALMLHCEARRAARRGADGDLFLSGANSKMWASPLIEERNAFCWRRRARGRTGRSNSRRRFSRYTQTERARRTEWEAT